MPKRRRIAAPCSTEANATDRGIKRAKSGLLHLQPMPASVKKVAKQNEETSILLRFPPDIRNRIYELALGGQYLKIHYQPHEHRWRQKNHVRYREHIKGGWRCSSYPEHLARRTLAQGKSLIMLNGSPPIVLSRVCRQLYHETALYSLSASIFSFGNEWEIKKFLAMQRPIQRRAIQRIHSDQQDVWTKTRLKDMTGLKTVYISYCRWINETPWGDSWGQRRSLNDFRRFWAPLGVKVEAI